MGEAYIVAAGRTAGGRRGGRVAGWHPADLAGKVLDSLIDRAGVDPALVEDQSKGMNGEPAEDADQPKGDASSDGEAGEVSIKAITWWPVDWAGVARLFAWFVIVIALLILLLLACVGVTVLCNRRVFRPHF